MNCFVVFGMQWGDEGKGKIIDVLSSKVSHVIRAQGGNNAGHTVVTGKKQYFFHLIPSGILYPKVKCYLGPSVVIDPLFLLSEIKNLIKQGVSLSNRFFISKYAHVIMPYHKTYDIAMEKNRGNSPIGTTAKGIGPCYMDMVARRGIRICDLLDQKEFAKILKENLSHPLYPLGASDVFEKIYADYLCAAKELSQYVADVETMLFKARIHEEKILLEGAQGALLDVLFGTYPYVTSSHTQAAGICMGSSIPPTKLDGVVGVMKAYTTRVGNGPFPTEIKEGDYNPFASCESIREIGVTTGRKRRVGWFDVPLAKQVIERSGITSIAITKLDILDDFEEIWVCTKYELEGKLVECIPADLSSFSKLVPIYQKIPGWKQSITNCKSISDLPPKAIEYLEFLQCHLDVKIDIISYGPQREKTIVSGRCL